jgi:hypothetical protein
MFIEPLGKWREPSWPDAIDPPAALGGCDDQPGRFQELEMLHDRRARNRQTCCELAGGAGSASEALKDDHTDRTTEQGEQTQQLAKLRCLGVRFWHRGSVRPG